MPPRCDDSSPFPGEDEDQAAARRAAARGKDEHWSARDELDELARHVELLGLPPGIGVPIASPDDLLKEKKRRRRR